MSTISHIGSAAPTENIIPRDDRDPKVLAASRLYEQQFLREMVKAMRRAVPESDLVPTSTGERIFREQLDDQYVEQWTAKGGVGFGDLVYNHIMERFVRPARMPAPKEPVPLQQMKELKPLNKVNSGKLNIELTPKPGNADLVSPWKGKVRSNQQTGSGMAHLMIDHGSGFRSEFLFDGISSLQPGEEIAAGAKLGLVSPDTQKLYWILGPS